MSKKVFFGQNDLRFLYYRYKDSTYYSITIFIFIIIVCILLLINVVMPQVSKYFSIREEVINQRVKIKTINDNTNFIGTLDKQTLDSQLRVASLALPPDQDVSGILSAISDASVRSGVTIGDYHFTLVEAPSKVAGQKMVPVHDLLTVDLKLTLVGNINRIKMFLTQIKEKLPLSEVSEIEYNNNTATISIKFFYKLFPDISFKEDVPLTHLADQKRQLIDTLRNWQTLPIESSGFPDVSGSASAVPLF